MKQLLPILAVLFISGLSACNSSSSKMSGSKANVQSLATGATNSNENSGVVDPNSSPAASPAATSAATNACAPVSGYADLASCNKETGAQCAPSTKTINSESVLCYFAVSGAEACAANPSKWNVSEWSNWCFYATNVANSSDYQRYRKVSCLKSSAACDCAGETPSATETCTLCTNGSAPQESASARANADAKVTTTCKTTCPAEVTETNKRSCSQGSEEPSQCSLASLIQSCKNCVLHSELKEVKLNQEILEHIRKLNKTIRMDINKCGSRIAVQPATTNPAQLIFGSQKYFQCKDGGLRGIFKFVIAPSGKSKFDHALIFEEFNTGKSCMSVKEILEHFYIAQTSACKAEIKPADLR